jgi:hypothetical protein
LHSTLIAARVPAANPHGGKLRRFFGARAGVPADRCRFGVDGELAELKGNVIAIGQ